MREYGVNSIQPLLDKANRALTDLDRIIDDNNRLYLSQLKDDDIRSTVYQDIKVSVGVYAFELATIAKHYLHYNWWDEIGLSNLTNEQKMANVSRMHEVTLFGSFHMAYAAYESALRQIHYSLDSKCCTESTAGIWNLRTCLMKRTSVTINGSCFPFLSAIRNTIHNAGVYRNAVQKTVSYTFSGKVYSFEHMKPFSFLYPDVLIDLMMSFTSELRPILASPTTMSIPYVQNLYRQI